MRKIIVYMNSTFNGVVTGDPRKDKTFFAEWTTPEFMVAGSECLLKTMETADTILYGRRTYEDLSRIEKWPGVKGWPNVTELFLQLGDKINNAHKIVVTGNHPLDHLQWGEYEAPVQLTGDAIEEQIRSLKNGDGGDIVIIGSPLLVRSLANAHLIDEYQIQVRPVVVNYGEHLFDNLAAAQTNFRLIDATPLRDGTIFVKYQPLED